MAEFMGVIVLILASIRTSEAGYRVGVGIADCTGPAADIAMMGFAKSSQFSSGIHTRLYSRAFIFRESFTDWEGHPVVFVSADVGMIGQMIKKKVIERVSSTLQSDLYNEKNVLISATHTHSGPGGYLQYILFNIVSLGFVQESFEAIVQGITKSIIRAHHNMQPARLYVSEGKLYNSSMNRSPVSYMANPEEERLKYDSMTDPTFVQLQINSAEDSKPIGVINWFSVHPTSMNSSNKLISSDNKGMASLLMEKEFNGEGNGSTGKGPFVAAFASSSLGDASPNIAGPRCIDTGLPCDAMSSTCGGRSWKCVASGPGKDIFETTKMLAKKQFRMAWDLYKDESNKYEVTGSISFVHQFIDMSNQRVTLPNGEISRTCPAAMGHSFAAGTVDGPGEFDFKQGTKFNETNPFWDFVSQMIKLPQENQVRCQAPKPILLDTGEMKFPYDWHPNIIDTQMLRIGQLFIAGLPGEFTTMAGRRMRNSIREVILQTDPYMQQAKIILSGLSNVYTHYVTTYEEYQIQRYEGASTLYGPHTLRAYQQQYSKLAKYIINDYGQYLPNGPSPPNMLSEQLSFVAGVLYDAEPFGSSFGDCTHQPEAVHFGGDTVDVRFVSGHPRNNVMLEKSFLWVEILEEVANDTQWKLVATDADVNTKFIWHRKVFGQSSAQVQWEIPLTQKSGRYRIRHTAYAKPLGASQPVPYAGHTNVFKVLPKSARAWYKQQQVSAIRRGSGKSLWRTAAPRRQKLVTMEKNVKDFLTSVSSYLVNTVRRWQG